MQPAENIIEELDDEFIEELQEDILDEEPSLEELILNGTEVKRSVSVTLPDGQVGGAYIRPLTGAEWNNCARQFKKKDMQTEVVKKGLLNKKGEPFNKKAVEMLTAGAITDLFLEIQKLSGIQRDLKAEEEFTKKLIDF